MHQPEHQPEHDPQVFDLAALAPEPKPRSWKLMLPIWAALIALVWLGLHYDLDAKAVAGGALVLGLVSSAFAWLLGLIGLVPVIGPLVLKVLALPLIWLLNAIGYLVSFIAIRRGYSQDVLTYRGLTVALLIGIVIGFVIGRLV